MTTSALRSELVSSVVQVDVHAEDQQPAQTTDCITHIRNCMPVNDEGIECASDAANVSERSAESSIGDTSITTGDNHIINAIPGKLINFVGNNVNLLRVQG